MKQITADPFNASDQDNRAGAKLKGGKMPPFSLGLVEMRTHFAFGGFFAESGGLLRKERKFFEAKSGDSFNAKNPREIAPGPFFY